MSVLDHEKILSAINLDQQFANCITKLINYVPEGMPIVVFLPLNDYSAMIKISLEEEDRTNAILQQLNNDINHPLIIRCFKTRIITETMKYPNAAVLLLVPEGDPDSMYY